MQGDGAMYLPRHFSEDRPESLATLVAAHPLGMLVSIQDGLPTVDHVPMLLEVAPTPRLRGHVSRANAATTHVADGADVLVVFRGADHYITPSWYAAKQVDGRVVPTWNYSVVEVRGRIHWFDDAERLHAVVDALTRRFEAPRDSPWSVDDAPADYLAGMLKAIVGFEIEIASMTGKLKASQNRSAADRDGVARGLATDGVPPADADELVRAPSR
jgi:transcriptional regulator